MSAEAKTIEYTEASRLPEPRWFWRRWFIFACTAWAMIVSTWAVQEVLVIARTNATRNDLLSIQVLEIVIKFGFYTIWGGILLYGVGASVTDVAHLVTSMRTARKETVTKTDAPGTIQTPDASVSTIADPIPDPPSRDEPALPLGVNAEEPPWQKRP